MKKEVNLKYSFIDTVQYSSCLNYYKNRTIQINNGGFSQQLQEYLPKFENVVVINSLKEYVQFINSMILNKYKTKKSDDSIREKYIYRGVSSIKQFKSTITRYYDDCNTSNNEFEFIKKFEENGSLKIGQFNNPIDLAAAAQHYGVNTRLIDWTYSPLIATLFSLYDNNNKKNDHDYYCVMYRNYRESLVLSSLNEEHEVVNCSMNRRYASMITMLDNIVKMRDEISIKERNKLSCFDNEKFNNLTEYCSQFECKVENIKSILKYFKEIVEKTQYDKPEEEINNITYHLFRTFMKSHTQLFIETNFSNERLRAQRGLFQIDCLNSSQDKFKGTSIILISHLARCEIIKYIDKLGFGYYQLMDDPENAAKAINKTIIGDYCYDRKINYD